jgi:serine protein kinase
MFNKVEDLLPIISFGAKDTKDNTEKHNAFIKRMTNRGYTEKQVKILVEWFIRARKSQ